MAEHYGCVRCCFSRGQSQQTLAVQRRGAEIALTTIAANAGVDLASKLPSVWEAITQPLSQLSPEEVTGQGMQI